ncbi:MAG: hypothetical protein ACTHNN_12530 [Xanthobacteraceae bacterium]
MLDLTAGDALREAARDAPDRTALVEVVPDGMASLVGVPRLADAIAAVAPVTGHDARQERNDCNL